MDMLQPLVELWNCGRRASGGLYSQACWSSRDGGPVDGLAETAVIGQSSVVGSIMGGPVRAPRMLVAVRLAGTRA